MFWQIMRIGKQNEKMILHIRNVCLHQGSQTRGPPDVFVRPATSLNLLKLLCGPRRHFSSYCGPRAFFLLKCGPRMKLTLRPLVYIIDFDIHSPTYLHFSRERDEKFFKANGVWQTPSYSFVKKHIKALFTRDIFAHNIEIKRYWDKNIFLNHGSQD